MKIRTHNCAKLHLGLRVAIKQYTVCMYILFFSDPSTIMMGRRILIGFLISNIFVLSFFLCLSINSSTGGKDLDVCLGFIYPNYKISVEISKYLQTVLAEMLEQICDY